MTARQQPRAVPPRHDMRRRTAAPRAARRAAQRRANAARFAAQAAAQAARARGGSTPPASRRRDRAARAACRRPRKTRRRPPFAAALACQEAATPTASPAPSAHLGAPPATACAASGAARRPPRCAAAARCLRRCGTATTAHGRTGPGGQPRSPAAQPCCAAAWPQRHLCRSTMWRARVGNEGERFLAQMVVRRTDVTSARYPAPRVLLAAVSRCQLRGSGVRCARHLSLRSRRGHCAGACVARRTPAPAARRSR